MTIYLDASVVVSLFISDIHTDAADRLIVNLREDAIVSELCALEFAASVSRGVRIRQLSEHAARQALADFDEWRTVSTIAASPSAADFGLAASLVRDFATKLAAADALHLAAAMNAGVKLATLDKRLAEAAKTRGAEVVTLD
ncbi:MAG TPA: type II toxin-antitoxin system VapC family toxin [Roseiarcus sp.]|nr:type II toxin-antitoxin system VapC family toxin [Roseiarcus sp.]